MCCSCLQADAAFICEYSRESEISRGRSRFFHGQRKLLLYSGRAHFFRYVCWVFKFACLYTLLTNECFRRFQIRGARHVIFYSLPEYPHFYSEILNLMTFRDDHTTELEDGDEGVVNKSGSIGDKTLTSMTLFSSYEQMALERIVGKKRCEHMTGSDKSTFLFK